MIRFYCKVATQKLRARHFETFWRPVMTRTCIMSFRGTLSAMLKYVNLKVMVQYSWDTQAPVTNITRMNAAFMSKI